jgi:DNA replication licensing factor MCM7
LAIIRLAQGLARLRFNDEVEQMDVDEALRLIEVSRSSINDEENVDKNAYHQKNDTISSIFLIIREMCNSNKNKTANLAEVERKLINKGFKTSEMEQCLEQYSNLNVLIVNSDKTEVTLL